MFGGLKMWLFTKLLNDISKIDHYTHEGKTIYHHKDFTLTVTGQKSKFHYIPTPETSGPAHPVDVTGDSGGDTGVRQDE